MSNNAQEKLDTLKKILSPMQKVLVAYSGGVDSTFLLKIARDTLGENTVALTAVSASLKRQDKELAIEIARQLQVKHLLVNSKEIENSDYATNPVNRCYFCKTELYRLCHEAAQTLGIGCIVDGFNKDDLADFRPGFQAKKENNIRSPLLEADLSKKEIRELSKKMGLITWQKQASPCLASRIPYGTEINPEILGKIERLEDFLLEQGLHDYRVRYHEKILRLEMRPSDFQRILDENFRSEWIFRCKNEGFEFVTLDIEGFRSGRLNEAALKVLETSQDQPKTDLPGPV